MEDFDRFLAPFQHPIMTALHPWLMRAFWVALAIAVLLAAWAWLSDNELNPALIALAVTLGIELLTCALNPYISADSRFTSWCLFSMIPLGFLALRERRNDWRFTPFCYLFWAPLVIIVVRTLVNAALTIPAYMMTILTHVKSGAAQLVVVLNQVPEPVKYALMIAAVLLAFFRELIKFAKSFRA